MRTANLSQTCTVARYDGRRFRRLTSGRRRSRGAAPCSSVAIRCRDPAWPAGRPPAAARGASRRCRRPPDTRTRRSSPTSREKSPGPLHLAEVRRAAGPHQGLQPALLLGAHDLDLEIPAAGRAPRCVRGATGRRSAQGFAPLSTGSARQVRRRRRTRAAVDRSPLLHDQEPVAAQPAGLLEPARTARQRAAEAVSAGTRPRARPGAGSGSRRGAPRRRTDPPPLPRARRR